MGLQMNNFLNPEETLTVEKYCKEIDKAYQKVQKSKSELIN